MSNNISLHVKSATHFDVFTKLVQNEMIEWTDTFNSVSTDKQILNITETSALGVFDVLHLDIHFSNNESIGVSLLRNRDDIPEANIQASTGFVVMTHDTDFGRDLLQAIQFSLTNTKEYSNNVILDINDEEVI